VRDSKIGAGRFGEVFKVHLASNEQQFFAQRVMHQDARAPAADGGPDPPRSGRTISLAALPLHQKYFFRELEVYLKIRPHPAVCDFVGDALAPEPCVVTEFLPNGTLAAVLDAQARIPRRWLWIHHIWPNQLRQNPTRKSRSISSHGSDRTTALMK
jgi:hypothetical protein